MPAVERKTIPSRIHGSVWTHLAIPILHNLHTQLGYCQHTHSMGNEASVALATAQAKGKFTQAMQQANTSLQTQPRDDKLAGCASRKEADQRRKERELEFKVKQEARQHRKSLLADKWASNKQLETDTAPKKGFFSK